MDFVTVGNAGNSGDTREAASPTGAGAVGYEYRIGKYEVTNGQWNQFVSQAGTPTGNETSAYDTNSFWSGDNVPTNRISWYEAAQFCNYLTTGDKSQGAYLFNGNNSNPGDFLGIDRAASLYTYGITYVIPTEDEWYKAAYYTGTGYTTYANGTDIAPVAGVDSNYDSAEESPWDVGSGTVEQNGTFDMMGNVFEWTETSIYNDISRIERGGCYYEYIFDYISSSDWTNNYEYYDGSDKIGFRVASIVPEPATMALLSAGALFIRRKKS